MAIPLIPVAAGAAVGALIIYGLSNKSAREQAVHGAEGAWQAASDGIGKLGGWFSSTTSSVMKDAESDAEKVVDGVVETAEEVAQKAEEAVETVVDKAKEVV